MYRVAVLVFLVASAAQADSLNCRLVGQCDTPGWARGVVVAGSYAYVADGPARLRVIDVSNPVCPVECGHSDSGSYAQGVAVAGNHAYVADLSGLRVIDVSDPANPAECGYCSMSRDAFGVAAVGNYAYVGDGWGGLRVIDVSNPQSPTEVGVCSTPGIAWGVAIVGLCLRRCLQRRAASDRRLRPSEPAGARIP